MVCTFNALDNMLLLVVLFGAASQKLAIHRSFSF